jgi:hypothetical protein
VPGGQIVQRSLDCRRFGLHIDQETLVGDGVHIDILAEELVGLVEL